MTGKRLAPSDPVGCLAVRGIPGRSLSLCCTEPTSVYIGGAPTLVRAISRCGDDGAAGQQASGRPF